MPDRVGKRLRELSVTAGPVGASVVLADWPVNTVVAEGLGMGYGVQTSQLDGEAALYGTTEAGVALLLSGSARYLLDRDVPEHDMYDGMSSPEALAPLLRVVVAAATLPAEEGLANARPWPHGDDYPVTTVLGGTAGIRWPFWRGRCVFRTRRAVTDGSCSVPD